jgi:hypothetical protein
VEREPARKKNRLTPTRKKASNEEEVLSGSPSREEELLSDHVFHFFGRTVTISSNEQFLAVLVFAIAATAWAVQQFRRRRVVILHRSPVSDQLAYELSRIADALDRIANRPVDQMIASASSRSEESTGRIPYSMFGR